MRNFDLLALILLTPGLLLAAMQNDNSGYVWLFGIQALIVIRLLCDSLMVRRPLLEPNLSSEGLFFSCFFFIFFLIAALIVNRGEHLDTLRTVRLEQILTSRHIAAGTGMNPNSLTIPKSEWANLPPGFPPFIALSERANLVFVPASQIQKEIIQAGMKTKPNTATEISPQSEELTDSALSLHPPLNIWILMLTLIIGGHIIMVLEFASIGYCHFGRLQTGIACSVLYLLHPYSSQMIGRLDHVIPAALILGGIMLYRKPLLAGFAIGTAGALVWYPFCLIPLWCSFYRHKGWGRFLTGALVTSALFAALLSFSSPELGTFMEQLLHMAGKSAFLIFSNPEGFWTPDDMFYRIPILAVFIVVCVGLVFFPSHKHLAVLICGSALLMLGTQFFQLYQGGLYMSWYLPLLILTVFRPNLENRTAQ